MANYFVPRINPTTGKKTVTINTKVEPTPADTAAVQFYVNAGYEIRFKSEKRAKIAAERAKANGFGKKKAAATEE